MISLVTIKGTQLIVFDLEPLLNIKCHKCQCKCIRSTLVVEESEDENVTVRTTINRGSCALIATHELKEPKFKRLNRWYSRRLIIPSLPAIPHRSKTFLFPSKLAVKNESTERVLNIPHFGGEILLPSYRLWISVTLKKLIPVHVWLGGRWLWWLSQKIWNLRSQILRKPKRTLTQEFTCIITILRSLIIATVKCFNIP